MIRACRVYNIFDPRQPERGRTVAAVLGAYHAVQFGVSCDRELRAVAYKGMRRRRLDREEFYLPMVLELEILAIINNLLSITFTTVQEGVIYDISHSYRSFTITSKLNQSQLLLPQSDYRKSKLAQRTRLTLVPLTF